MAADTPTIVATSGGFRRGSRSYFAFAPLLTYAIDLAGVSGREPRVCFVLTAGGDQRAQTAQFFEAAQEFGARPTALHLFPMPSVERPVELLLEQDVVWVGGGSVANLIALWRLHALDQAMRAAWQAGVVLAGVSAGSICWHAGGTTDSFGPNLRAVEAFGFLPQSNGVHYDSEPQRRPFFQRLIAEGALPDGYATDDGVGLVYRGTELVEAVSEIRGKRAYDVRRDGDRAVEEALETRLLPGAI